MEFSIPNTDTRTRTGKQTQHETEDQPVCTERRKNEPNKTQAHLNALKGLKLLGDQLALVDLHLHFHSGHSFTIRFDNGIWT